MTKQLKTRIKKKRIQNPKAGKVIRISDELRDRINQLREPGETWNEAIAKVVTRSHMWTLPSKLVPTKSLALGLAISEAVKEGRPLTDRENPIKVFEG